MHWSYIFLALTHRYRVIGHRDIKQTQPWYSNMWVCHYGWEMVRVHQQLPWYGASPSVALIIKCRREHSLANMYKWFLHIPHHLGAIFAKKLWALNPNYVTTLLNMIVICSAHSTTTELSWQVWNMKWNWAVVASVKWLNHYKTFSLFQNICIMSSLTLHETGPRDSFYNHKWYFTHISN